jgi:hypothetical protein
MNQIDAFPAELAAARAAYVPPRPLPALCASEGCGELALPDSRYCVECDELLDYEFSDDELYGEPPLSWQEREAREVCVKQWGPL